MSKAITDELTVHQRNPFKHGFCLNGSMEPEYRAWLQMRQRCTNPNATGYKNYGGRGISVCQEWADDFMSFYLNVGSRPSPAHSIDRIDNDGNYEPGNCRWATRVEQAANSRVRSDNKSGTKGVSIHRDGWVVKLGREYLGVFKTKAEAIVRRARAEQEMGK